MLRASYELPWDGVPVDLGGSNNLNLHLPSDDGGDVARIYAPWTSPERLEAIQRARQALTDAGLPFAHTMTARDGGTWIGCEDRVIEVERYVAGDSMDIDGGLRDGMTVLGRIHTVLSEVDAGIAGRAAPFPNHVDPEHALVWTRAGTATIRAREPTSEERRAADLADVLAAELRDSELGLARVVPRQLVHGDFWDNNVLFRDGEIVVILDLDFMGERARIDDVALTLYYTNSTLGDGFGSSERIALLASLVDAYDRGLDQKLSGTERAALPYALARTVLCFVGMIPSIDDRARARRLVREITADLEWSLDVVRTPERWQSAFA